MRALKCGGFLVMSFGCFALFGAEIHRVQQLTGWTAVGLFVCVASALVMGLVYALTAFVAAHGDA